MKIGQFSDSFLPIIDGVGRVVYNYCETIANKGHECTIVAPLDKFGYRGKFPFEIIDFYAKKLPIMGSYDAGLPPFDLHYNARMDMTDFDIRNEVFANDERPILTKAQDEAPVFHYPDADVRNSLVSAGCSIEGRVENSIIFRSVNIGKKAVVKNSVIMMHCEIGDGAVLDHVIADKNVTITGGVKIYGTKDAPVVIGKEKTI